MVDAVSERNIVVDYAKQLFFFYVRARGNGREKKGGREMVETDRYDSY